MSRATIAVIVGNRDFFPDRLITEARKDILDLFKELDIQPVILGEEETKFGSVETYAHAKVCGELFRKNRDQIDGILVTLPNFGDEKGIADTIKLSGLNVPILVQAYPDDLSQFTVERRRDAFCGKISVCNNLHQYGMPFSLTAQHTVHPKTSSFKEDLIRFVGVCRVVKGLRNARLGMIGARPNAFNTVRFSEKLFQAYGISVSTIDLSEIFASANKLSDNDTIVKAKLEEIRAYAKTNGVPASSLVRMAKLGIAISNWMTENELHATAIQCWNSVQRNFGVNVCTLMSMMSEKLMPSACEADVAGVLSMYALQLASGKPSALVDWNNNYGDDPDRCVFFHCGNWAKSFLPDIEVKTAEILGTILGEQNTFGAVAGRVPAGEVTFSRITTDDLSGIVWAYVGEGELTDDPLDTFGSRAVIHVPNLQKVLEYICKNGFEHHVAMTGSHVASILVEAFENYLGWDVYHHKG